MTPTRNNVEPTTSATDELRRLLDERVVRCRDCANAAECEDGTLDCHGALVQTWDYYNDEPLRNPVPPNGFCAWGVRRAES